MNDSVKERYSPQSVKLIREKSNKTRERNLAVIKKGKKHLEELERKRTIRNRKTI